MDALTAALDALETAMKGGPDSGNFGHAGRPGFVGGSQAQGSTRPAPVAMPDLSDYIATPKLASEISGHVPMRDGKPVPVETRMLYHVTRVENLPSLLKDGFDLTKVRPRWQNDYAISLSPKSNLEKAMAYFMPNIAGTTFDTQKYAVVAVTVRGRFMRDPDEVTVSGLSGAQSFTRAAIKQGYDASDNVYIYNPKAIGRIHVVETDKLAAANAKLKVRKIR